MNHEAGRYGELVARVFGVATALLAWYWVVFPVWGERHADIDAVQDRPRGRNNGVVLGDRRAYDRLQGIGSIKQLPLSGRDLWLVFCFFDALTLTASGAALIRDLFSPPATDEQHIPHVMMLGLFTVSVIAAIALLLTHPPKKV
jgi:hypothetical protein